MNEFVEDEFTDYKLNKQCQTMNEMLSDPFIVDCIKESIQRENEDPYIKSYRSKMPEELPGKLVYEAAELKDILLSYRKLSYSDFNLRYGRVSCDFQETALTFMNENSSDSDVEDFFEKYGTEGSLEEFIHILGKITAERVRDVPEKVSEDLAEYLDIERAFDKFLDRTEEKTYERFKLI